MKGDVKKGDLIRISEIVKATGVAKSTIHFYTEEGVLPRPRKTSRNMAYYDPRCISDVLLIKELQAKRRLPLSAIKFIMRARHEGQEQRHVESTSSLLEMVYSPSEVELEVASLNEDELAEATDLPAADLVRLKEMGIISKAPGSGEGELSIADKGIIMAFKKLSRYGLRPSDLEVYGRYWNAVKEEAEAVHSVLHHHPERDKLPVDDIYCILVSLRECLSVKAYRQVAQECHQGADLGPTEAVGKRSARSDRRVE